MSELLAWAMDSARTQTLAMVADLTDDQMCLQSEPGEHHPAWILGHLLLGDVYLLSLLKARPLAADLPALLRAYGPGATPAPAANLYHSKRELTERLTTTGARRAAVVREMIPEHLDNPTPDALLAKTQPTIGHHLQALVFHEGYHGGQLSSWRRAQHLAPTRWTLLPQETN